MVLKFFRSQQPATALVGVFLIAVSWFVISLFQFGIPCQSGAPLYILLLQLIPSSFTGFYRLLSLLLISFQAYYLNHVINKHNVLYKESFMPGLCFGLFNLMFPELMVFHPVMIVNTLLIFLLDGIFSLFKNEDPLPLVFNCGTLMGISFLVYEPSLTFVLVFFAGLLILRPFSWKEWMVTLLGFTTPLFFTWLVYFLQDKPFSLFNLDAAGNRGFSFQWIASFRRIYAFTLALLFILLLISINKLRENFYRHIAKTRNYQLIILVYLFLSVLLALFTASHNFFNVLFITIPLSAVMGYFFLVAEKKWVAELFFFALLILVVLHYIPNL